MGPVMVVVVDPRTESRQPLVVGLVRSSVGPLVEHRPIEALGLAVGLRPERLGPLVADVEIGQGRLEAVEMV
jgi:hypothetical protein